MTRPAASHLDSDERLRRYAELAVGRRERPARPGGRRSSARSSTRRRRARSCGRPTRPARGESSSATPMRTSAARPSSSGRRTCSDKSPEHQLAWVRSWREARPALIQLTGDAEPELFADLDPALVGKSEPRDLNALYRPLVAERLINWAIVASPNVGWATSVFGEPDLERLWEAVGSATRLDAADPVAAWRQHDANLKARSAQLNEQRFDAIRFRGPGTELFVGLMPVSRWMCAAFTTVDGIEHIPEPADRGGLHLSRTGGAPRGPCARRCRWPSVGVGRSRSRAEVRGRQGR